MRQVSVYTDGSCFGNGKKGKPTQPAGWGVLIEDDGCTREELFGPVVIDPESTRFLGADKYSNNTAELCALAEAMLWLGSEEAGDVKAARIFYDSKYAADVMCAKKIAHTSRKLVQRAKELYEETKGVMDISLHYVAGHTGVAGNERADELAKRGCKETCTTGRYAKMETVAEEKKVEDHEKVYDGSRFHGERPDMLKCMHAPMCTKTFTKPGCRANHEAACQGSDAANTEKKKSRFGKEYSRLWRANVSEEKKAEQRLKRQQKKEHTNAVRRARIARRREEAARAES